MLRIENADFLQSGAHIPTPFDTMLPITATIEPKDDGGQPAPRGCIAHRSYAKARPAERYRRDIPRQAKPALTEADRKSVWGPDATMPILKLGKIRGSKRSGQARKDAWESMRGGCRAKGVGQALQVYPWEARHVGVDVGYVWGYDPWHICPSTSDAIRVSTTHPLSTANSWSQFKLQVQPNQSTKECVVQQSRSTPKSQYCRGMRIGFGGRLELNTDVDVVRRSAAAPEGLTYHRQTSADIYAAISESCNHVPPLRCR
ncbi:hypothetical protein DFH09DRAFT_1072950 [Mycena vulgaris]|nr:hypothetical protein DFH09DRAFT_1072950 [Mycena vulgaris]